MPRLTAELFASDPHVIGAKKSLLDALRRHRESITGIRPPDPDLTKTYEETLAEFARARGGALFYPYLGSGIGNGPLVELADGSVKYDFISGIGVHHWGHSHPDVVGAVLDAALRDVVMQGNLQQNVESVRLAETLIAAANSSGASLAHCFFSTSGAMANENALKLMFHKKAPADRILAFSGCFAGRTLALAQVTDKPEYRVGLPHTISVDYIPFFDPDRPEESIRSSVAHLERHLARHPGKHAGMVFELVQGEGGFKPGSREFFLPLMERLKQHEIPILADEIQTFGRTPELFAFQYFGLGEFVDLVTVGKMTQLCVTLFREEFRPPPGLLSQTFTAGTSAIAAAQVIVDGLTGGGFFGPEGRIARLHDRFVKRFEEMECRHPGLISGPYGLGAMVAFTPLGGDPDKVKRFVHALFHAGVIGFYCGRGRLRARFLPPAAVVTDEQIDEVCGIVENTLVSVAGETRGG